jgi:hypothetical protein
MLRRGTARLTSGMKVRLTSGMKVRPWSAWEAPMALITPRHIG